ncbi:MAG: hypothetical protein CMF62_12575 [Magnetococcales bacterium]|nr:hypothetical protein [Magnetococcales bacterium]|tara:strand:- start:144128 stop:145195 length:1068 start_codon:yes stop_codon:yes gene_type:complete
MIKQLVSVSAAILLAACGTTLQTQQVTPEEMTSEAMKQRQFALMELREVDAHVQEVGFRVLEAAVPMCEEQTGYSWGVTFWNEYDFTPEWRPAAQAELGVDKTVKVKLVIPGSAAAKAGLKAGDQIIKINDRQVGQGSKAVTEADEYAEGLKRASPTAPVSIVYGRGDTVKTATLNPIKTCNYPVIMQNSFEINAYADGDNIIITRGIVEFTRNDEELAMIIGHELAHNVLRHIEKKQSQMTAGMLGGLLLDVLIGSGGEMSNMGAQVGASAYSPEYESEADYMGLYATALAGYDIAKAPYLWRRMGSRNTGSITMTSTHPPTAGRFVALEKTVEEISKKVENNQPLVPERKIEK